MPTRPGPEAKAAGVTLEQWQQDLSQGEQAAHQLQAWLNAQGPQAFASATLINNAGVIPRIARCLPATRADLANALRVGWRRHAADRRILRPPKAGPAPQGAQHLLGPGRRAMASQAAYCAAKAGMDHFTRCVALDEAIKPHGAKVCSLAPGVIDTDMQVQLRGADPAAFPDRQNFANLKTGGQLTSPADAATRVLAWLERADFGTNPVADVRDA